DPDNLENLVVQLREEGRDAAQNIHRVAHRTFVSRGVRKTVITTTLLLISAGLLYIPAVVGYLLFYYKYLPDQVTTVPVHLQYGVGPNPFGIAALSARNRMHDRQPYDITVSLTLPRSPTNLNRGNFMPSLPTRIDLPAYLAATRVLFTSTRPALIPYADPLASLATRILLLGYHMLFPRRAGAVCLAVPMAEQVSFSSNSSPARQTGSRPSSSSPPPQLPTSLLLEVQAGQEIQVYDVSVTFTARLRGLRWFMYTWWATAFFLLTLGFWAVEVLVMAGVLMAVAWCLRGTGPGGDLWQEGGIEDDDGDGDDIKGGGMWEGKMADVPAAVAVGGISGGRKKVKLEEAASSAGSGAAAKGKQKVKTEEGDGEEDLISSVPDIRASQGGGEADDEGDGKGKGEEGLRLRDSGAGTGYSGQASRDHARWRFAGRRP
ncbi:Seipin, partial [Madurella mycetomatis]